jgi:DNA polymerase-3 subunit delta
LPAHVLYGDSFLVAQALRQLESAEEETPLLEANRHVLRGSQARLPELLSVCQALPFMDTRRLVVLEGLLATLEREGRTRRGPSAEGRGRGRRADATAAESLGGWEALAPAISQMPETTWLVLVDGPVSENNPLLRALRPVAQVQHLTAPAGEPLARWIKTTAQQKGAGISPAAIRSLADLVGSDLWTLDRELEKLSLYAGGRGTAGQPCTIEDKDVRELVASVREASIFAAVDAMLEGKPAVALRLLQQLRQDGRDAGYILAMVERQLRLLALARHLAEQRVPQSELPARLGVASPFVVTKTLEQARRHSWPDITWRFQRLLEADLAIKTGRLEPDLALELLAADMAGQVRS